MTREAGRLATAHERPRVLRMRSVLSAVAATLVALALFLAAIPLGLAASALDRADRYFAEGNFKSAIIELKSVLQDDPDHAGARVLLGKAYFKMGDNLAAERQFEAAQKLGVRGLELMLTYARLGQGRYDEVLSTTPGAVSLQTEMQRDLFVARAEALLGLGRFEEARSILDLVLQQGRHAQALAAQARLAFLINDPVTARSRLDEALALAPDDWAMVVLDGELHLGDGRFEAAKERFSRAIALNPAGLKAYLGKVRAHIALSEVDAAGEIMARLKKQMPGNLAVLLQDAIYELFRGNYRLAKAAADQVLSSFSYEPRALFVSGVSAFRLGHYEQARMRLSTYLTLRPEDVQVRGLLGAAILKLGAAEEAYDILAEVETLPLDSLTYLGLLTTSALATGERTAGLQYLEQLAKSAPQNAEVHESLGLVRHQMGDHAGGIAALERSIELDPTRPSPYSRLFSLWMQYRNMEKAVEVARAMSAAFPDKGEGPIMVGIASILRDDWPTAMAAFRDALKREPGNMEARRHLNKVLESQGNVGEVRRFYEETLRDNPGHLPTLLAFANLALKTGHEDEAETLLKKAIDLHPDAAAPRIFLGQMRLKGGEPAEALALTEPLLASRPGNLTVLEAVGVARMETGDPAGGLEIFESLAKLAPFSAASHNYLMGALERNGRIAEALQSAKRALELDPELEAARFGRARYLAQLGRLDEAKSALAALKQEYPSEAKLFSLEGRIALLERRPKDAITAMERAFELEQSTTNFVALAQMKLSVGRYQEAVKDLQSWLDKSPGDVQARSVLADIYIALGRFQDAREHYQRLIEQVPSNARFLNNLSLIHAELGAYEEALPLARYATGLVPGNSNYVDTLAVALLATGGAEEALEVVISALRASPDSTALRYRLALAMSQTGDQDAAVGELKNLLTRTKPFPEKKEAKALLQSLTQ